MNCTHVISNGISIIFFFDKPYYSIKRHIVSLCAHLSGTLGNLLSCKNRRALHDAGLNIIHEKIRVASRKFKKRSAGNCYREVGSRKNLSKKSELGKVRILVSYSPIRNGFSVELSVRNGVDGNGRILL